MANMVGKTVVITGATAGIGEATAVGIARQGADLALVGRDKARMEKVAAQCRQAGAGHVATYFADFGSLTQVRALAASLLADLPRIDVLVNNAGLISQRRSETVDGYERVFAVNHLAPYLLTRLLVDRLVASAPARVVMVASDAYTFGDMTPEDWMSTGTFRPMKVYGRSKLGNMLFTYELAQRLAGSGVTVNCLHPGFVSTSLARDNKLGVLFLKLARPFIRSPEQGAATSLLVSTAPIGGEVTGKFFSDGQIRQPLDRATDPVMAKRLWDDSAALVGLPAGEPGAT